MLRRQLTNGKGELDSANALDLFRVFAADDARLNSRLSSITAQSDEWFDGGTAAPVAEAHVADDMTGHLPHVPLHCGCGGSDIPKIPEFMELLQFRRECRLRKFQMRNAPDFEFHV